MTRVDLRRCVVCGKPEERRTGLCPACYDVLLTRENGG